MDKEFIGKKIELWQPLIKTVSKGKTRYDAILSDDSTDRDDEIVGTKALEKIKHTDNVIVGLLDHENKVLNQVCEWTNKRLEKRNGHNAFIAEPKFFLSNPNAQIIKGMLDEGATIGVSIGAIVKDYETKEIDGTEKRVYTDLDILEASFVSVAANAHARIMATAKMFKKSEEKTMDKTYTEKEFNEVTKEVDNLKVDLEKVQKELELVIKEKEEVENEKEKVEEQAEEDKTENEEKVSESEKKLKEVQAELKKIEDMPWYKGNHSEEDTEAATKELKEAMKKGFLPVVPVGGN